MIFDINEENVNLLAMTGCPVDMQGGAHCMLQAEGLYNRTYIETCSACWLKWLSKESEDNHE